MTHSAVTTSEYVERERSGTFYDHEHRSPNSPDCTTLNDDSLSKYA